MSWTLTASGSAGGTGATNPVVVTINSGSSDIIWAIVCHYGVDPTAGDLTDSQGNSYTLIPPQGAGGDANVNTDIYYKISPTNNAALAITFTPNGSTGNYPSLIVFALTQGSAPTFNTSVGNGTNSGGSIAAGSIGNPNDLVVEALAFYAVAGNTIDSGFSAVTEVAYSAGQHIGLAAAWKEIAAATNPTWTVNVANVVAAQAAAVSGTGSGAVTVKQLAALGVG